MSKKKTYKEKELGHHQHQHHHHNKFPLYADTQIWSQRFLAWKQYDVRRPRLPLHIDTTTRWVDMNENRPSDFSGFIGDHNSECMATLHMIKDAFEDSRAFPNLLMLVGPSGSGKSAITHAFMYELSSFISLKTAEKRKKLYMWINCKKYLGSKLDGRAVRTPKGMEKKKEGSEEDPNQNKFKAYDPKDFAPKDKEKKEYGAAAAAAAAALAEGAPKPETKVDDFNALWQLLTKFLTTDLDKSVRVNYRFIILDNADFIPPSQQQSLKRLMEEYVSSVKFILVTVEANKIISAIQSRAVPVRTKSISESDALLVILSILYRNSIGFDRDGLQAVFEECKPGFSTSKILEFCQDLFNEYQYISVDNVNAHVGKVVKNEVSTLAVLQPLQRCDICTLIPPCKHYDNQILLENAKVRRRTLPRYKGGMTCPEFLRYGHCSFFNENGHCSLDHPRNIHVLRDIQLRCPSCTIPWPCGHCLFMPNRTKIQTILTDIRRRIGLCKQLIAPDPPVALTKHIDIMFPNYKANLTRIFGLYVTESKEQLLDETQHWLDSVICVIVDEYKAKESELVLSFGELGKTPMLIDHSVKKKPAGKGAQQLHPDDDDSSVLSLESEIGEGSIGGDISIG